LILAAFLILLAAYLYAATRGLGNGIHAEPHAFRQSQTAIGIRSIVRCGKHEVPVLGPGEDGSWSIPFEFPCYAWAVAASLHRSNGAATPVSN